MRASRTTRLGCSASSASGAAPSNPVKERYTKTSAANRPDVPLYPLIVA